MSDVTTQSGGAASDASGAQVGDNAGAGSAAATVSTAETAKMVKQEELDRALADVHRFKNEAKAKADEIATLKANQLKSQNDYKTLYEQTEAELKTAKAEKERLQEGFILGERSKEIRAAALKAGIRKEALDDLDLLEPEGVVVEGTTQGRVLVNGAETYIDKLKRTRPHWFQATTIRNVNTGGGGAAASVMTGEITPAKLIELERSGNKEAYNAAYKQYLEQRKKKSG